MYQSKYDDILNYHIWRDMISSLDLKDPSTFASHPKRFDFIKKQFHWLQGFIFMSYGQSMVK